MRRLFIALVLMFSLMGCATTSHNYASYSRSFDNDFVFYSQYGIAYKSGDFVVIGLFFSDENTYLSDQILNLRLGLYVVNPKKEFFEVRVESKFTELDTGNFLEKNKFVYRSQMLPEEFINIDLPRNIDLSDSQVEFKAMVLDKDGKNLFESEVAKYRIKGSKKTEKEKKL
jgi:hypothetical protein